ncbi:hypothetical protein GH714_001872 [Hevea brasiliensis]|uniref:Uncharacterized protein n=1 Tax=Hevea brasiliensis TaxID=3981 RepID=A0A6A6LCA7_HEVBR|nr:hypothetical protein GH714_001872 [Hevea brasiliensis]
MAAGDQSEWAAFTYAAAPLACGQDMDVPEIILNFAILESPKEEEGGATGDQAAWMSTPGAVRSGGVFSHVKISGHFQKQNKGSSLRVVLSTKAVIFLDYLENIWAETFRGQLKATSLRSESAMMAPTPLATKMPEPSPILSHKTIFPATLYEFIVPATVNVQGERLKVVYRSGPSFPAEFEVRIP